MSNLPMDAKERKEYPIFSGVLKYFPDAIAEVAHVSYIGNQQHHPDTELHWDRSKSTDESDALLRHLIQSGTFDTDGLRHSAKAAWRALALLQKEIEAHNNKQVEEKPKTHPKNICEERGYHKYGAKDMWGTCSSCGKVG